MPQPFSTKPADHEIPRAISILDIGPENCRLINLNTNTLIRISSQKNILTRINLPTNVYPGNINRRKSAITKSLIIKIYMIQAGKSRDTRQFAIK